MKLHVVAVFLSLLLHLHGAELLASEWQIIRLNYTLITANSPDCSLADNYPVLVLGNLNGTHEWTKLQPQLVYADSDCNQTYGSTTQADGQIRLRCYELLIPPESTNVNNQPSCIQLRFVQTEHRGGFCDCWAVVGLQGQGIQFHAEVQSGHPDNLTDFEKLEHNIGVNITDYGINNAGFCLGSASVPRELILSTQVNSSHHGGNRSASCMNAGSGDKPHALDINECKNNVQDTVVVNFDLQMGHGDELDSFDEGVEFALRLCNLTECSLCNLTECDEWIPIRFYTSCTTMRNSDILIENKSSLESHNEIILRGYNVTYEVGEFHKVQLTLCDQRIAQSHFIQFRWLQTVRLNKKGADEVNLDNVKIVFNSSPEHDVVLLEDDFSDSTAINHTKWSTRRVLLNDSSVQFGGLDLMFKPLGAATILSREISTTKLPISSPTMTTTSFQPTTSAPPTDIEPTTSAPPTDIEPTTSAPPTDIEETEKRVLKDIQNNQGLKAIYDQIEQGDCPTCALQQLNGVVGDIQNSSSSDNVTRVAVAYLLSRITSNLGNDTVNSNISQVFLSIADNLTVVSHGNDSVLAGSTLLKVLDTFALNSHNTSHPVTRSENIVLNVTVKESDRTMSDAPIEQTFEDADISIPGEVMGSGKQPVRMASFLFKNVSGLLPESLNGNTSDDDNETRLVSPVISATFQCDNCTTSNLSTPVNISFKLSPYHQELLENDPNGIVKCVFWQFDNTKRPSAVLFPGQWSQEGCKIKAEIKSGRAVCQCNHLTHFAILLSARPLNLSRPHTLALETIGYIGVTVSLIAMAMTILVFIFLNRSTNRPLQKIRNYIHIQLCVTLGIAQIIFVAGIKPQYDAGTLIGGVPVGCRLVAVLLHYWFLVSFMWMLMEGVILYVALVLVFVKHHGRYIAAFTIISYGLPLLYVGALTVPLGFARNEEMRKNHTYDYGYEEACYLNPKTSFIWSLIAPVLLIFVANIGFFIMAIVIMYKHQKRQTTKSRAKNVKQWLKACISLSLVMGITWIIGVLVIEVEELFVLAYIFTIFVAFQGLFIFITFVLISESKRVKELYRKWWKGKVAESDFLSKHFGEKTLTSTMNSQHYVTEMSTVPYEKGLLAPDQVIDMKDGSSQADMENFGTIFDVTFVPTHMSASPTEPAAGEETSLTKETFQDTVSSDEIKRLSTNNCESSSISAQPIATAVWPLNSHVNGETPPDNIMNCNGSTIILTGVKDQ